LAQTLDIYREVGNRWGEGMALHNLGIVSHRLGSFARAGAYYEQALDIHREIGQRQGEGQGLSYQGLLAYHLGDYEAAREYSQQALLIAENLGHRDTQGLASTFLGHACVELGLLAEATNAYHQALTLRQELDQLNLAMEPLAGLARVYLAQGDLTQAQAHVEEILSYLESQGLDDTEEPFRVYLTCYRILDANQDPRVQETLSTAHNLLQEQASKIEDEEMRRLFLENVPAHQEIVREFEAGQSTPNGESEGGA
jgi:tetratricopeptide (TPR) repeat protein